MTTETEALRRAFEGYVNPDADIDLHWQAAGYYASRGLQTSWLDFQAGHAAAKAETAAMNSSLSNMRAMRRTVTYVCPVCDASMVDDQDAEIARLRAAVAQLRDALLKVKWRPAQESAFIANVNLQDVERRYGVEVDWNSMP